MLTPRQCQGNVVVSVTSHVSINRLFMKAGFQGSDIALQLLEGLIAQTVTGLTPYLR